MTKQEGSQALQTITREYDALNRVTSYTDTRGNIIRYGYDEFGNLTELTYPNGEKVIIHMIKTEI